MLKRDIFSLAKALELGELSSRELTEGYFEQIDKENGEIGAYITLCRETALSAADASDARRAAGESLGSLDGIPFSLKDNFCTEGVLTTCGSRFLEGYIPPYTATAVKRLTDGGAVLLGKTNMDEFGMGSFNENSAFFPARNPLDKKRSPGGSSGGSAASVAGGMAAFSIGSDTGGSVRLPAAFCGLVGFKPTYGRISRYGLVSFASSLDTVGMLTSSVRDSRLLLSAMAGKDQYDATSLSSELDTSPVKKRLRVGIISELSALSERSCAIENAKKAFSEAGYEICEISLPSASLAAECYYIISSCEASSNLARFDGVRYGKRAMSSESIGELYIKSRSEGFGDEVKRRIMLGTFALCTGVGDGYYRRASALRARLCAEIASAFEKCDILMCPVARTEAPILFEKKSPTEIYADDLCTVIANLSGIPAVSVPLMKEDGSLPLGVQLMAPPLGEKELLFAGETLERSFKRHE